jgi:hypothetical protein
MSFIKLQSTDFVVSNDAVTAPAWSTGNPTLQGNTMYLTPGKSSAPTFFTDVYYASGATTSSLPQFSLAYGHISGSGSTWYNPLVPGASPTRTVYGQFRNMVYGDENTSFNFGGLNTAAQDIFVINVNRNSYRESLFPGTFNLVLSNGATTCSLTTNANQINTVSYLDCGRVYDLVSGSNGYATSAKPSLSTATAGYTPSGSYGFFLPDIGVIILNPAALTLSPNFGGISLVYSAQSNVNNFNWSPLYSVMSQANSSFTLNSYETVSSDYVFVRVPNNQFNYTTNPSIISGSGALLYSTLINNPQTYMTTVGLYNDNQELLAVAKLSKPLVKDFTKEALVQVKLNW